MHIIGIDLSGPHNVADTHAALFRTEGALLRYVDSVGAASDQGILDSVKDLAGAGPVVIGIDAPLSYNQGGGDRPSDRALRHVVAERGGGVGVMPPTMIRMVYLTLRGIALTRMFEALKPQVDLRIVEVHPGAALLMRGAPRGDITTLKRDSSARAHLLDWLGAHGLMQIPRLDDTPDHFVMACAAALAACDWAQGKPAWCFPARPPAHPYDFAC